MITTESKAQPARERFCHPKQREFRVTGSGRCAGLVIVVMLCAVFAHAKVPPDETPEAKRPNVKTCFLNPFFCQRRIAFTSQGKPGKTMVK